MSICIRIGVISMSVLNISAGVYCFVSIGIAILNLASKGSPKEVYVVLPLLVTVALYISFSLVLLLGAVKRRRSLVEFGTWATIVVVILGACGLVIFYPFLFVLLYHYWILVFLGTQIIFWICIRCFYQKLVNESEQQQNP